MSCKKWIGDFWGEDGGGGGGGVAGGWGAWIVVVGGVGVVAGGGTGPRLKVIVSPDLAFAGRVKSNADPLAVTLITSPGLAPSGTCTVCEPEGFVKGTVGGTTATAAGTSVALAVGVPSSLSIGVALAIGESGRVISD